MSGHMCFQETTVLKFAYQEDVVELLGNFCKLLMGGIKCIHQFKKGLGCYVGVRTKCQRTKYQMICWEICPDLFAVIWYFVRLIFFYIISGFCPVDLNMSASSIFIIITTNTIFIFILKLILILKKSGG